MNPDDFYQQWKRQKQNIEVSPDFTDRTMQKITCCRQTQAKTVINAPSWLERLLAHPLTHAALIAAGFIFAVCRFLVCAKLTLGNQW